MSKLVTFEQAIDLKKLGYDSDSFEFCFDIVGDWVEVDVDSYNNGEYKLFYTSEALDWLREVKGVKCSVSMHTHSGNCDFVYYMSYYDCNIQDTVIKGRFKVYSEAESALLDALIEYVSK